MRRISRKAQLRLRAKVDYIGILRDPPGETQHLTMAKVELFAPMNDV